MKKFITLTLCLLLCVITFGLTGCDKKVNETIDISRPSYGNGGTVTTQGDYVYFVNGYNSYSVITKSNLNQSFNIGGLYRAKLNSNGEFDYTESGSISNAEKISGNLTGFENTSLYVFGNFVYYATPITEVDKKGNLQTSKLEFRRVSITGGEAKRLYQSSASADATEFEFYYAEGKVYLMINENGTLKCVTCTGEVSTTTVASGVTSVALPRDSYDVFISESYKNIFYTKTNDDGKIEIYNYNILTNRAEYKKETDYKTCELLEYKFGHLYYKASRNDYPSYTYFYRIDATKNAITSLAEEKITSNKDYTDLYFLGNESDGYIVQTSDKTYYLSYNSSNINAPILVADEKIEIMESRNSYVYFKSGNDIKRINYYDLKTKGTVTIETLLTVEGIKTYSYDIDDNNLYVYATSGSNTYLYSIRISNIMEEDKYETKLLGVYNLGDEPKTEN